MEKPTALSETICSLLTEEPINLLEIGPTLVGREHTEGEIVNALYWLVDARRIELMPGNRVRLLAVETVKARTA